MQETSKKILTYTILPIVFTGVLASSATELITKKRKEEDPHISHQEFSDKSFIENVYMTSLTSSATAVSTFEQFLNI